MEGLRWWLLLLTALMFSMSGCASHGWTIWATNPAHFASGHHIAFSMKSHPSEASITEGDIQDAPQAALPSTDMTGKWRGTSVSRGLFGDERSSEAHATFSQSGKRGFGRIAVADVNAASGLPLRVREAPTGLVLERE